MRRADRLFRIVQHLRGGQLVTGAELAQRMEVSLRTIYRDVADLIGSGVPIEGEAGVGYVMRAGYDLPPLMFTAEEIVALVAGARMIRAWGGIGMAAAAEEALSRIDAVLPEAVRSRAQSVSVHAPGFATLPEALRHRLDRIEAASHARHRLTLAYADENGSPSDRVVRPLGLFFWGKVWTLVAWCELRQDFRTFRLDRIAEMTEGPVFPPDPDKGLAAYYARERRLGRIPEGALEPRRI
ncbi:YafY family transcriptional regulator [Pseudooceanicola sp. CBS1P-1]|uniref:WYL domain-containing protein n=1 Tax=Pseudooceanicola albus TaxID=2692189 RepID=A0A6L7FZN6_9RHOB|nr:MULTISPECIES: YafY family protein [Pseudooceanicola]MBT9384021.1 YafY family transcriptional regulator [Pseudooceanicola endophyticus]MXN16567.1 WYL domain-containing protein [Pseudooceanicola albus]